MTEGRPLFLGRVFVWVTLVAATAAACDEATLLLETEALAEVGMEGGSSVSDSGQARLGAPLVFVDGQRVGEPTDQFLGSLDPDAIDRIEVLKGEAAIERFGPEAEDGVIQIFTKPAGDSAGS